MQKVHCAWRLVVFNLLSLGTRDMKLWPNVRSSWLDIGQLLFLRFYAPRSIKTQRRTRPIYTHLDRTSLVNKRFIIWPKRTFSCGQILPEISWKKAKRGILRPVLFKVLITPTTFQQSDVCWHFPDYWKTLYVYDFLNRNNFAKQFSDRCLQGVSLFLNLQWASPKTNR